MPLLKITRTAIEAIAATRALQVARAALIQLKDPDASLPYFATEPGLAPVEWRNGKTDLRAVRIDVIAKWTALLPDTVTELDIDLAPGTTRLISGGSAVTVLDPAPAWNYTPAEYAAQFGEAIVVADDDHRGVFTCASAGDAAELKVLRAELTVLRKAANATKENTKQAKARYKLFSELRNGTVAYRAAQTVLAQADRPALVVTARQVRDAKRTARRYSAELRAYAAGTGNAPVYDYLPADTRAQAEKWLAEHARLKAIPGWKTSRHTRLGNIVTDVTSLLTKSLGEHLQAAVGDSNHVWASAPDRQKTTRRHRHYTPDVKITVSYGYESAIELFKTAKRTVRSWPATRQSLAWQYVNAVAKRRGLK